MTDLITLQLITTILMYCSGNHNSLAPGAANEQYDYRELSQNCFKKIWTCGHKVTSPISIVSETHNCITKHINGKLE